MGECLLSPNRHFNILNTTTIKIYLEFIPSGTEIYIAEKNLLCHSVNQHEYKLTGPWSVFSQTFWHCCL